MLNPFKGSDPKESYFTEAEARELTWSKLLEEKSLSEKKATVSEFRDITVRTAHEVGEQTSFKRLLLVRSGYVVDYLKAKFEGFSLDVPYPIPYRPFLWAASLLALVLGILTNEWTVAGNRINLLSPPLLAVIVWNICVYCILFAGLIFNRGKGFFGPVRQAAATLLLKIQARGSDRTVLLRDFYKNWSVKEKELLKYRIAEIFHFAALAFGLGVIISIGFHGWGTAYTAGWESTWLYERPEAVENFLKLFYGLAPFSSDFFDHLTVKSVEAMRFGGQEVTPAGPWLLRLCWVLVFTVVIPRALLGTYAWFRANWLKNHFTLNLESPYYSNIFRQWKGKTMFIRVIPFSYPLSEKLKEAVRTLVTELHPETSKVEISEAAHEDSKLPELVGGDKAEVLALFALTSTPEAEVQGAFLKELKKASQASGVLLRVIVDTSGFEARFSHTPQRIAERRKNWESFLSNYGVNYAFVNLTRLDSADTAKQFERV